MSGSLGNRLWKKFIREFSWDQHLWKEGKEADAGRRKSWTLGSFTKGLGRPVESFEARDAL